MYGKETFLAIIPARGGSKGIPRKNIIDLRGKPLIGYTIEAARGSRYLDCVMVSTEDEEIAAVARALGAEVPFLRPAALAADTSRTIDAIVHAVRTLEEMGRRFDHLVLLQPTQPLRTAEDIDGAIEAYRAAGCRGLVTVSEAENHPILIRSIEAGRLKPLLHVSSTIRRQDMPAYYRVNGCVYINPIGDVDENLSFNDNPVPYIMEKSHSVDIDELSDLALAAWYLDRKKTE